MISWAVLCPSIAVWGVRTLGQYRVVLCTCVQLWLTAHQSPQTPAQLMYILALPLLDTTTSHAPAARPLADTALLARMPHAAIS